MSDKDLLIALTLAALSNERIVLDNVVGAARQILFELKEELETL